MIADCPRRARVHKHAAGDTHAVRQKALATLNGALCVCECERKERVSEGNVIFSVPNTDGRDVAIADQNKCLST